MLDDLDKTGKLSSTLYYASAMPSTTSNESLKEVMKRSRRDMPINMRCTLDLDINRRCFDLDL